jgi:hypothetical protein
MQHENPAYVDDPHAPPGVPPLQAYIWPTKHLRIVHKQRARKLRKRGVMLRTLGPGKYGWHESQESYERRMLLRMMRKFGVGGAIAKTFAEMTMAIIQHTNQQLHACVLDIQTATGSRLDCLASIPQRPAHWTDDMVRQYALHGYVLEGADVGIPYAETVLSRKSPPLTLYYHDSLPQTIKVDLG